MLRLIKELIALLTPRQRRRLLRLQILVVAASLAEVAGVTAVGPFMTLVADPERLAGQSALGGLLAGIEPTQLVFWLGLAVMAGLALGGGLSMLTIWQLSRYAQRVGATIGSRLFRHYLAQPWLFHTASHSGQLTKQISQESARVTHAILTPLLVLIAKLALVITMTAAMVAYRPLAALSGAGMVIVAYLLVYAGVRRRLARNGQAVSVLQQERFRTMAEAFGGIKEILLLHRQEVFAHRFELASDGLAECQASNQVLAQVPRHAMETCGFAAMVTLILVLLKTEGGDLAAVLPVLAVYALAGLKILPAAQQVYASAAQIRANLPAFRAIEAELRESFADAVSREACRPLAADESRLPHRTIALREVTVTYPGKAAPALNRLSLEIPARQVIGLVGASGAGKSTALDVLLGLLPADSGGIEIDGAPLRPAALRRWQSGLGYVPQSIFLADASIRENIAFGLPPDRIDEERLRRAVRLAHLEPFLAELPQGLATRVGERGLQLSGGQRQRIGIARALYRDADVLIFDEATNALDGITEKLIMDAIHDFAGKKTIVLVAHRLGTVKACDRIYLLAGGRVVDQGSYQELLTRNESFRRMAAAA